MAWARACAWSVGRGVIGGCCCVLLGLERAHDLLSGPSVPRGKPERVAAVAFLVCVQLGERRAVDGEVVGEAERERAEVLLRLAFLGRGGLGLFGLALFAASAGVLERPRPIGARGDWSISPKTSAWH